jgi:hypothetical protein
LTATTTAMPTPLSKTAAVETFFDIDVTLADRWNIG